MIRPTPIYVTWISAGNNLPGFCAWSRRKNRMKAFWGLMMVGRIFWSIELPAGEKEKGIDNPQAIPSRKINKKRWTKDKQQQREMRRIRWADGKQLANENYDGIATVNGQNGSILVGLRNFIFGNSGMEPSCSFFYAHAPFCGQLLFAAAANSYRPISKTNHQPCRRNASRRL